MDDTSNGWQPCFADPWRGIAHFDGITIEADPIQSALPDRVLPCILDEQVFFCRMLRRLLGPSKSGLAIDLGSGSGVLSISAATLGMRVVGVDCSERAITFANFNARQNGEAIARRGGEVSFEQQNLLDGSDKFGPDFDYALLNPPFAEVSEGVAAPLCVLGGRHGQETFRRMLAKAAKLLKPGGEAFAVQLLQTDSKGRPVDMRLFADEQGNSPWGEIEIFPALAPSTFPRQDFQDAVLAVSPRGREVSPTTGDNRQLCMAFLRLTRLASNGAARDPQVRIQQASIQPPCSWFDRIRLHQAVVNSSCRTEIDGNSVHDNSTRYPAGATFLRRTSPYLTGVDDELVKPLPTPTQKRIASWVVANGLLGLSESPQPGAFQALMVEAVPWYLEGRSNKDLASETFLFASSAMAGNAQCEAALSSIFLAIERINAEERSAFRHQDLEEDELSGHWQVAISRSWNFSVADGWSSKKTLTSVDTSTSTQPMSMCGRSSPLEELAVPPKNPAARHSFEECLWRAVKDYSRVVADHGLIRGNRVTCHVMALPLPAPKPNKGSDESGYVYVYAWQCAEWCPEAESLVADLATTAALLYEEDYTGAAKRRLAVLSAQDARRSMISAASHELNYVVDLIQEGITAPWANVVQHYFRTQLQLNRGTPSRLKTASINPQQALGDWFKDVWLLHYLLIVSPDPASVTEDFVRKIHEKGTEELTVTVALDPSKRAEQALYDLLSAETVARTFLAAIYAGLSNAIKHTFSEPRPHYHLKLYYDEQNEQPFLIIENSFESNYQKNVDAWNSLQNKAEGSRLGSNKTIEYLVSTYYKSESRNFITIDQACLEDSSSTRVTWRTMIPVPSPARRGHQ